MARAFSRTGSSVVLNIRMKGALLLLLAAVLAAGCQGSPDLVSRIEAPWLVSPPDGAVIPCSPPPEEGQPQPEHVIAWTAVQGAAYYVLEIYRAADGALAASDQVSPGETGTVVLLCGADYLWRVAAVASYPARPAHSATWRFSITAAAGGAALRLQARPQSP